MRKYPLEALVELREKKVDQAATALAEATLRREAAERTSQMAEARCHAYAQTAASIRDAELDALSAGRLRAGDLARADAWGLRTAAEWAALGAAVERAAAAEGKASEQEVEALATVVERRGESRVVVEHRAQWDRALRRAVESREETASEETWRPKR